MNEATIKQWIQQGIQQAASANRFTLGGIQRHTHNNVDSPYTFEPILTYVGIINYDGTYSLLPKGWTVVKDPANLGTYYITHNLGTVLYSCVASCFQSTNIFGVPVIEGFANEVDFTWGDVATGAKADTSFYFILTVINNKSTTLPSYVGSAVN